MTEIKKVIGINEADTEAGINEADTGAGINEASSEAGMSVSLLKAESTELFREEYCDNCPRRGECCKTNKIIRECRKTIRPMNPDEIRRVTKIERSDKTYRVRLHQDDVMLISGINVKAKSEEEARTKVEREIKLIVDHLIPIGNR